MCGLLRVSRAGYCRWLDRSDRPRQEADLQEVIQQIAVDMTAYGYRRTTAELRRRGITVNHKRVLRCELDIHGVNQLWVADLTYIRLVEDSVYLAVRRQRIYSEW